jgi:hypothetical protein
MKYIEPIIQKLIAVITSRTFWTVAILVSQYMAKTIDQTTFITALSAAVIAYRTADAVALMPKPATPPVDPTAKPV